MIAVGGRKRFFVSKKCEADGRVIFRIFTGLRKQHIIYDMKTKFYIAIALAAALLAASCSSGSDSESGTPTSAGGAVTATTASPSSETTPTTDTVPEAVDETSVVVPFTAANGGGTVAVSGDGSPIAAWFANLPGEVSLDLADADVGDAVSVVEELVSFWFFQDTDSGDVPPRIYVSADGKITDTKGTAYVVEVQPLPAAPGTEPTVTAAPTASAPGTTVQSTSEPAAEPTATSAEPAATTAAPVTTTLPEETDPSPAQLQVRVLNGSGVPGAAGRLSASLQDFGYILLPAGNAPERYRATAVYYVSGAHRDEAEEVAMKVAETAGQNSEIAAAQLPSAGEIQPDGADVIVVIGTDSVGETLREEETGTGLRPSPRNDVSLPLPASVPRDRFVPGLADIQIFSQVNDQSDSGEVLGAMNALSGWLNAAGRYSPANSGQLFTAREKCDWPPRIVAGELQTADDPRFCTVMDRQYLEEQVWPNIERTLAYFGFTPQNVCGAPPGYSFTDLLQPTRELSEETDYYTGDAIFTTDRLIELYGGQRINPEANLEFYIGEAVQTAYDSLRLAELSDEIEAPQMILCDAWKLPSGEIPEAANGYWYALLTPGIQPRESLLSQGTYHVKEISRNGNRVQIVVCHPTLGSRYIAVWWRDAGYRAEATGTLEQIGCQAAFEADDYISEHEDEPSFTFSFGERVFSASDLLGFPRS